MDIIPFFKLLVEKGASDLFFSVGALPNIKIEGIYSPIGQASIKSQQMAEIALSIMRDKQQKEFEANMEPYKKKEKELKKMRLNMLILRIMWAYKFA